MTVNYAPVDTTPFSDPELAETFNEVILYLKKVNNVSLMKINYGMELAGNTAESADTVVEYVSELRESIGISEETKTESY